MASEKVTALVEEVKGLTVLPPPLLLPAPLPLPLPWKKRRPSLTWS